MKLSQRVGEGIVISFTFIYKKNYVLNLKKKISTCFNDQLILFQALFHKGRSLGYFPHHRFTAWHLNLKVVRTSTAGVQSGGVAWGSIL